MQRRKNLVGLKAKRQKDKKTETQKDKKTVQQCNNAAKERPGEVDCCYTPVPSSTQGATTPCNWSLVMVTMAAMVMVRLTPTIDFFHPGKPPPPHATDHRMVMMAVLPLEMRCQCQCRWWWECWHYETDVNSVGGGQVTGIATGVYFMLK